MSFPDQNGVTAMGASPLFGSAATAAPQASGAPSGVRGAIARAAEATGVDFSYLLAQAKLESSLNPAARAATSSAAGLYQFTSGTWLHTLRKHGADAGLGDAGQPATAAALADPAARAQLMALRFNPEISARMAAELAGDNHAALSNTLGRTPDASELYLAHFLGADGAGKFLGALAANPGQAAMTVAPKAAAANRAIFFDAGGNPRSLQGVMDLLRGKMASAMAATSAPDVGTQDFGDYASSPELAGLNGLPAPGFASLDLSETGPAPIPAGGPLARQFAAARDSDFAAIAGQGAASSGLAPTTAMSDTLRNGFAMGAEMTGGAMPDAVRTAYARFRAIGL